MSCAKVLPFAALCLGLASFVASVRADYDLEPLMRRYGDTNQSASTDDENSVQETMQPAKHIAVPHVYNPNQVSPAIYSSSDDDAGQPSSQMGTNAPTSRQQNGGYVRRTARPAMISTTQDNSDGSAGSNYPQSAPSSQTRSVQAPQRPGSAASNVWSNGDSGSSGQVMNPETAGREFPEMVSPGSVMSDGGGCGCGSCGCGDSCGCGGGCGSCGCGGCGGGCGCGDCCFSPCGTCGWFGGAEYLYVRPDFSIAQAFVQITGDPTTGNELDKIIQQKYSYQSSVRAFFGYRTECGDEIRFGFWNFNNGGTAVTPDPTTTTSFGGQFMLRANNPGDFLVNNVGLNMNVYDIDYSHCCCFGGGPRNCGCGNCPVWTLRYSAGIRIADIRRNDDTIQNSATPIDNEPDAGFIKASFIGAGPRVGLEGRRFFSGNRFSLFAKANFSLLLGQSDQSETITVPNSDTETTISESLTDSHDRIIPVGEIELGGDWNINRCWRVGAGYLFQAWWDMGEFEHVDVTDFQPIQNASIMGFDGFYAHVEYNF